MKIRTIVTMTVLILALITISTTTAVAISCDICVNETGWWRDGDAFTASTTPIQAAVDNANSGETIFVKAGIYTENVDIATPHLTLQGEGAGVVTVTADDSDNYVFGVTADYINISGFNATGATGIFSAGIDLYYVDCCNISNNTVNLNTDGIYLDNSSNNNFMNNIVSNNDYGITLLSSSNSVFMNNTVDLNIYEGIYLDNSNNNNLTNNIVSENDCGITLFSSSNNMFMNNTVDLNTYDGIYIEENSSNNNLTNNMVTSNGDLGIFLDNSNNNTLTNNIASNNNYGITLLSSSNNTIYNNDFNNAYDDGNNIWNITPTTGTNIIGGSHLGGNYWSDYVGVDNDDDGLGDTLTPYNSSADIENGGDYHPLVMDNTPPSGITYLQNITHARTYINWTWTDPVDSEFSKVMVYLNGVFHEDVNSGVQCYNATLLTPGTTYDIGTLTVDTVGNINHTWVNHTATTAPAATTDTTPPVPYPEFVNITIDGNKSILFANHSDSLTEGNWVSLMGGDPIKLPSPFTLTYNGTNFSTSTNGRINVTVDVEDNTDYLVPYPHTTHDMFTNVTGKNSVSMHFNGTTYFANNRTDVYLVKISQTSLKDAFNNITDGNFVGFYDNLLGNPYEIKLNEPLDVSGDMNLAFSEVDAGDYAIFILLNNSDLNKISILSATTFQVLEYDSTTNILSPEVTLGSTFNANISLTNAPTDTYKYIATLVHESAYHAEMQLKFNGTRAGTNLTLNGVEIIQGYEVLGVGLSSVNITTVLNTIRDGIDPINGSMVVNDTNSKNALISFDTGNLSHAGNYILLTGVYNSGDKLVAFDQSEILISTDNIAPVINSVTLDPIDPNTGDDITVTVNATDNIGVTNVTAGDVFLSYIDGDDTWMGTITAIDGNHTVNVSASDAAGNTVYDETANYTATTPGDTIDPVINSVTLNTTEPNTGDEILVTVNATDNVGVTNVTADDVFLSYISGDDTWVGTITAIDGNHTVNVSVSDAAGNTVYDETANYTATGSTLPVVLVEDVTAAPNGYAFTSIMVNNVTDLGSGSITVTYNTSVVHVTNVTSGDGNALAVQDWNVDNSTGSVRIFAQDADESHNGDVVLAIVNFHAVGEYPDSTPLAISSSELIDYTSYDIIGHSVTNGIFSIIDNEPPVITDAIATPDVILNDNGRPRIPGTNVTVLNATVVDIGSGVMNVTIDLSSIGGSDAQVMERINGTDVWTVATNATSGINLTHELVVTASDGADNTNTSVIGLTVLLRGDVVRDGDVNSADALYIAKYLVGKEPMPSLLVSDMSPAEGDGRVTSADALYLAKYLVGKEAAP